MRRSVDMTFAKWQATLISRGGLYCACRRRVSLIWKFNALTGFVCVHILICGANGAYQIAKINDCIMCLFLDRSQWIIIHIIDILFSEDPIWIVRSYLIILFYNVSLEIYSRWGVLKIFTFECQSKLCVTVAQLLEWGGREAVLVQVKRYCSQTRGKVRLIFKAFHNFLYSKSSIRTTRAF
jgi:hypothetical protein